MRDLIVNVAVAAVIAAAVLHRRQATNKKYWNEEYQTCFHNVLDPLVW